MKRRHFLCTSLLAVAGCTTATRTSTKQASTLKTISQPEKLRFAVSDVKGLEDLQKDYGALQTLLEEILEKKIEFFPVESYIAAASALQLNQVDLVFTGPSEYVVMRARTKAIPIVAIERQKYYCVIATQVGSGIQSVAGLKGGQTIALWDVGSTSGHLGPTKLLIDAGLDPKTDLKIQFLGKQGLPALQNGTVAAWGGSVSRYDKFLKSNGLSEKDFPILAKGPTLPADPFVASSQLDPAFVGQIQQRLLQNQNRILKAIAPADGNKFEGAKMVQVNDTDYNMIRDVYKAIGQGNSVS
ncbi:phosphate/phosphite/phosphonate ABC transporter substrate-binding protein [Trichocoleus sp. FACHB-262]|uniref:phosphate/phosphite/phosphonate ABC transporter substrate-binding protein n=1 Tax=Trichocoleus sp. FACHB-262 TaxID=2692869 RepID=UPI00168510D4|nr:phosphate/phosphite/phosphonate ABC transporter substrate-binding protein [Trichocoleus sp. FACHB-262]MBD2124711.1 phosphate/phosphite/phosphonate ABC transporter substrate-binding protein [Trichocoleus sp. FACHB-262]